jgi:hypothetical protein
MYVVEFIAPKLMQILNIGFNLFDRLRLIGRHICNALESCEAESYHTMYSSIP